ncbi:endonuclease VIII [Luteimonas terricola]|uniref:DNA-(apurinic or apyrimidinic site) lyase n=1 Tax=Luteimonas terricola TaxID=645597 RepID=A0ABQ2EE04_9GAMM|nr:endonuclease VIII [Luteimonas terricola]GGK05169.1 endonuclease 8 [Luteimonas terricola]
MPEGPEIRRAADRLAAAVAGEALVRAWFAFPGLKRFEASLVGRRIESITPRGKALLIRFDDGWTMYSHNQLYGVWKVVAAGERPETKRSLRVALDTARGAILLYSASDVSMWRSDEVESHPFLLGLGPDVLDPALDATAVAARLQSPGFRGRALGGLLLDQGFLAGMGNYLRSEVLFAAGLRPGRRPKDLDPERTARLAQALLDIPRLSYATRGIAPADRMRDDYLTDTPDGFRFQVFGREGQPCPACGTAIERMSVGSRRLYLCPACQS